MRLEQLEYLLEISKTHSISLASQNLHISHQSLSKSIQNLEIELEIPIIMRSSKGIHITPQGQEVVKAGQRILSEINALQQLKLQKPTSGLLKGNLKIMFCNSFDINRITTSVNAFSVEHPHVQVDLIKDSLPALLNSLCEQTTDLGLISLPGDYHLSRAYDSQKLKDLSIHPMLEDKLLVAVSKVSPLASHKSISLPAILKHPLILFKNQDEGVQGSWLIDILSNYGSPNFLVKTNSAHMYIKSIADNTGLGFFTNTAKRSFFPASLVNITFIPIRPTVHMYYSYVTNATIPPSPLVQAYIPFLIK